MNKKFSFRIIFLLTGYALFACSVDDNESLADAKVHTCQMEVNATKDCGEVETRGFFFGGNNGTRFYVLWDQNDKGDVYYNDSKVGTCAPNSYGYVNSKLKGTIVGAFNVGDILKIYLPKADMEYIGQKGTLGDLSLNYVYMTATTMVSEVTSSGDFVDMMDTNFSHQQFFFRFRFSDSDNIRLPIEQLTIHAAGGKLVQKKNRDGSSVTYGDIIVTTEKDQNAYPNEVYVAIQNDYNGADTYSFTVKSGGFIYESVDASSKLTKQYANGAFTRVHRVLPLKGPASRVTTTTTIDGFEDGGGDSGGNIKY